MIKTSLRLYSGYNHITLAVKKMGKLIKKSLRLPSGYKELPLAQMVLHFGTSTNKESVLAILWLV